MSFVISVSMNGFLLSCGIRYQIRIHHLLIVYLWLRASIDGWHLFILLFFNVVFIISYRDCFEVVFIFRLYLWKKSRTLLQESLSKKKLNNCAYTSVFNQLESILLHFKLKTILLQVPLACVFMERLVHYCFLCGNSPCVENIRSGWEFCFLISVLSNWSHWLNQAGTNRWNLCLLLKGSPIGRSNEWFLVADLVGDPFTLNSCVILMQEVFSFRIISYQVK